MPLFSSDTKQFAVPEEHTIIIGVHEQQSG